MSHRFPPIASPKPNAPRARVRVVARDQVPSLPWMELALGLAFLILMRGL